MTTLANKIDFIGFIAVDRANPNGDPINGNQPRTDYDGYGEISDVCIKRKIRNRLQDMGENILVKSADRADDGYDSIRSRVEGCEAMKAPLKLKEKDASRVSKLAAAACHEWLDVRAFGQLLALKKGAGVDAVSCGIRGPVSIHTAVSLEPVVISSMQITKSVNGEPGGVKSSDTMGMKHRIDFGVYKLQGSINVQLAERTGFTTDDAQKIKQALITIFDNDASSARPEGSIEMRTFYWITHENKNGNASAAKVHHSVTAKLRDGIETAKEYSDYVIDDSTLYNIAGLTVEKYVDREQV